MRNVHTRDKHLEKTSTFLISFGSSDGDMLTILQARTFHICEHLLLRCVNDWQEEARNQLKLSPDRFPLRYNAEDDRERVEALENSSHLLFFLWSSGCFCLTCLFVSLFQFFSSYRLPFCVPLFFV